MFILELQLPFISQNSNLYDSKESYKKLEGKKERKRKEEKRRERRRKLAPDLQIALYGHREMHYK
jgi:hypothetical protein